ncbi:hypothetical protein COLO4_21382 [Corchorus olitorius]|uniref:Uncharacterized protein n=1 Tax=Corchorus olitorius TaxID=93759 RepID=A0A1R3ITL8_9ROSI|nr:hypothetical protein COLO4_21382 [Corchorus olitorius]
MVEAVPVMQDSNPTPCVSVHPALGAGADVLSWR